ADDEREDEYVGDVAGGEVAKVAERQTHADLDEPDAYRPARKESQNAADYRANWAEDDSPDGQPEHRPREPDHQEGEPLDYRAAGEHQTQRYEKKYDREYVSARAREGVREEAARRESRRSEAHGCCASRRAARPNKDWLTILFRQSPCDGRRRQNKNWGRT